MACQICERGRTHFDPLLLVPRLLVSLYRDAVIAELDVDAGSALLIIQVAHDNDPNYEKGDYQVKSVTIHFNLSI